MPKSFEGGHVRLLLLLPVQALPVRRYLSNIKAAAVTEQAGVKGYPRRDHEF